MTIIISQDQINNAINQDKQAFSDSLSGKRPLDCYALKRLVLTELSRNGLITENYFCGFSRKEIHNMVSNPERYGKQIIKLSQYMYLKSGYYKRLAKYYSTMPKYRWTVDTEVRSVDFKKASNRTIESGLYKFISNVNSLKLEYEIERIFLTAFINDVCYGYLVETDSDSFIFYLRPEYCEIKSIVNGVYGFAVNVRAFAAKDLNSLPDELRLLIKTAKENKSSQVIIPYDKSICIKYNDQFTYLFPPLFQLIADILDVGDYKELAKAKTEQECYRMLLMRIPTTNEGQIALGDDIVVPFVQMAESIVPKSVGVIPLPMDAQLAQFKSDQAERDKVEDSITQLYEEAGVSKALMAGATSGSELVTAIKADAGDIFRMYRQIERLVNLHMKMRGIAIFGSYTFCFSMMDVTIFNEDEVINRELKLAQASIPNKMRLVSAAGISPAKLLGNMSVEDTILNLTDTWKVLKTSATQSSKDNLAGGRPQLDDAKLSSGGETTRENDTNNPDNRV